MPESRFGLQALFVIAQATLVKDWRAPVSAFLTYLLQNLVAVVRPSYQFLYTLKTRNPLHRAIKRRRSIRVSYNNGYGKHGLSIALSLTLAKSELLRLVCACGTFGCIVLIGCKRTQTVVSGALTSAGGTQQHARILPTALEARHGSTSIREHVGGPDQFGLIGKALLSLSELNRVFNLMSQFLCVSIPEQFGLGTVSEVPLTKPMLSASQVLFLVGFFTKCRFLHRPPEPIYRMTIIFRTPRYHDRQVFFSCRMSSSFRSSLALTTKTYSTSP